MPASTGRAALLALTAVWAVAGPAVAQTPPQPIDAIEEMVVTGIRSTAYTPPPTRTATKTDAPPLEVPQSVQVLPRALLEDQAVVSLQDATRNVAGVTAAYGFSGLSNACVRVRGFTTEQGSVGCTYYRNGVRVWAQPLPFAAVEAVEVVKGPNTVLFGRNEPGGLVNVVTKRPTPERTLLAQQAGGSFGSAATLVDVGGALTADRTWAGRFSGAYSRTDNFRDGAFDRLANVTLGLAWLPDAATRVDLQVDLTRNTYRPDFGIPALGDRPAPVSVRQSYKQDYIDSRTDTVIVQLTGSHRLSDVWNLRADGFFSFQEPNYFNVFGSGLDEATLRYPVIYFGEQFSERRTGQVTVDLIGKPEILGLAHEILVGVDYNDERYDGPIFFAGGVSLGGGPESAPDLDLFGPDLGSAPRIFPARDDFTPFGSVQRWVGVYVQDRVRLTDQLIFNAGFRVDRATGAFSPDPVADAVTETAVKPRFGLTWRMRPDVSVYAQYQEAFGPNNGRAADGSQFPGQTANQVEVGAKWSPPDGRILATLALFNLQKRRLLTADANTPDPGDSIALGEVRNRGIELDVSGRVTESLSLIGSYALSEATTTRDADGFQGNRFEGVPRHAGSLWLRWQALSGLAFGGGVFAEGLLPGDLANSFALPGYVRFDLLGQYRFAAAGVRWTAQVNVNNLFDRRYFAGVYRNSRDFIQPGTPRAVTGTLRAEF